MYKLPGPSRSSPPKRRGFAAFLRVKCLNSRHGFQPVHPKPLKPRYGIYEQHYLDYPIQSVSSVVRRTTAPAAVAKAVRLVVHELEPDLALSMAQLT